MSYFNFYILNMISLLLNKLEIKTNNQIWTKMKNIVILINKFNY